MLGFVNWMDMLKQRLFYFRILFIPFPFEKLFVTKNRVFTIERRRKNEKTG